jgi:MYXO-CTERM domain-containing protein
MRPPVPFLRIVLFAAAVAMSLGGRGEAAVFVYEGFDYASGSILNGQNGGSGFTGPWLEVEPSNGNPTPDLDYIQSGSMLPPTSWASLDTTGNSLRSFLTTDRETTLWRPLNSELLSSATTLWMSFLVNRVAGSDSTGSQEFMLMLSRTDRLDGSDRNRLFIGDYYFTDYLLYGKPDIATESFDQTGIAMATGVSALLVVKLELNPAGTDHIELFVNPAPGSVPTDPDAELDTLDLTELNYLGVSSKGSSSRQWTLDEIRIGESYADVTPTVPEPATALMGLVGAAALGFRRRRR